MAAQGPALPVRNPATDGTFSGAAPKGRTRRGWIPGDGLQVGNCKMERIKPWLFTFLGVAVSLAIINRVPMIREFVYGTPAA